MLQALQLYFTCLLDTCVVTCLVQAELDLSQYLYRCAAECTVTMRLLGTVMGHEQQVLTYLQQHLLKDHVLLVNASSGDHAAVTLQFHRMKQRLPADELAAVLAASAGM